MEKWQILLTVAKALVSIVFLCLGLHLLRKAKENRAKDGDKPQKPLGFKELSRWQKDPELLGLFFAFMGSVGIIYFLWDFWQIAAAFLQGNQS